MRQKRIGIITVIVLIFAAASVLPVVHAAGPQTAPKPTAAATAVKESPALVGEVSKATGATPEQAAGAAGSLFSIAKSRLNPADFSQVAAAVPGMNSLLKAAPATSGTAKPGASAAGASGILSQVAGSGGGLASAASAFTKLGLKPEMVAKVVPVLTSFVSKSGGANVGNLLASVLK